MSDSENVGILKRAYAAFNEADIPGLLELYAEDAEWDYPSVKELPYGGPRRGRDEIRQFFDTLAEVEETLDFQQSEFIAQADKVVVLGNYRARVKSTGRVLESHFVHVVTIRSGRMQRFELYFDTAAAAEAYRK